ncbi:MAG TPA: acetylglutamate kinase, partial [Clostridium sp.]|nr:acetylglutamate kinase [Clostridium sp.]
LVGIHVVLVHGGGPEISGMLKKLDISSRFIDGLRYTDEETAEVVQMVLAGKTNKDLVSLIGQLGGKAIGLCGIDGGMIKAKKIQGDYGYVGEITEINTEPITQAIQSGYIPVIATVGTDCKGQTYNINADTAAAEIAAALQAENIITLTDIRGLMRDISDENSLIPVVKIDEVETLINDGIISGGMIPKVKSLKKSVLSGVEKAVMIDGRIVHSILIEMFSDEGVGTMFMK